MGCRRRITPFSLGQGAKKPPVVDMTVQIPVKLAPQRWSQAGKAWIKVLNPQDFPIGCALSGDRLSVEVLTRNEDFLQVNRLLTRREASSLFRSFVSAEPEVWSSHFLEQWNTFWNRPQVSTESIGEVIRALPQIPPFCISRFAFPTGTGHSNRLVSVLCVGLMVGLCRNFLGCRTGSLSFSCGFSGRSRILTSGLSSFPCGH